EGRCTAIRFVEQSLQGRNDSAAGRGGGGRCGSGGVGADERQLAPAFGDERDLGAWWEREHLGSVNLRAGGPALGVAVDDDEHLGRRRRDAGSRQRKESREMEPATHFSTRTMWQDNCPVRQRAR